MQAVHRSAALQATAVVMTIAVVMMARRGSMFLAPVPAAAAALLGVATIGVFITLASHTTGLWIHTPVVAWPVLAPAVAASVTASAARMMLMSSAVVVVAVGMWWLRTATHMPAWPLVLVVAAVAAAVLVDLLYRDPYRELRCHPLCTSNAWALGHRPGLVEIASWSLVGATALALGRAAMALVEDPPPAWRAVVTMLVAVIVVSGTIDHLRRATRDPGSSVALRWETLSLLAAAGAGGVALLPGLHRIATRRRALRWALAVQGDKLATSAVDELRRMTGDDTIRLRPADAPADRSGDVTTTLSRGGVPVAVLEHRSESADLLRSLLSAPVSLALENEALLITANRELEAVTESRRAVVERSNEARSALQRDLHDGAQQRLIVLGLELSALSESVDADRRPALLEAAEHAATALSELRELAHGDLPPILQDEGLCEALVSLAERSTMPVELHLSGIDGRRFPVEVERAAYRFVVGSLTGCAVTTGATIDASIAPTTPVQLVVQVRGRFAPNGLETDDDLVRAVGGSSSVVLTAGLEVREGRFPCG